MKKIIVCGLLIDASMIYQISDIYAEHVPNLMSNGAAGGQICKYEFAIHFINDNTIVINKHVNVKKYLIKRTEFAMEEYTTHMNDVKEDIERVRNELIKFWSDNQPDIPQITFKQN